MTLAQEILLARLHASPVHLRRSKDKARDAELIESVKRHGVIQPILARPITGKDREDALEVVAGHRRLTAAKAAGLESLPGVIRELSDAEALELQVVENQQRSDVHPLEEATGYGMLMGKHGYSVEDIAAKVGKSRAYVYGRLKLNGLCKAGREALLAGELETSVGLLVARIPEALQQQALEKITKGAWHGSERGPMSHREAAEFIQREFMLRLADAPFDPRDATLAGKGTCGDCPKRTGNQRDLFGDVKGVDICTDPLCYRAKVEAASALKRAALEAEGKTVLKAAVGKKVFGGDRLRPVYNSPYALLDDEEWVGKRQVKIGALLRKWAPDARTVFCERPDGVLVEMADKRDVARAAAKARPKQAKGESGGSGHDAKRNAEAARRAERVQVLAEATLSLVIEKLPKAKDAALWLLLAKYVFSAGGFCDEDDYNPILTRHGAAAPAKGQDYVAALRKLVGDDVVRARACALEYVFRTSDNDTRQTMLRDLTKLLKITPDQAKRRANAEQAAAKERAKQTARKSPSSTPEADEGEEPEGEE